MGSGSSTPAAGAAACEHSCGPAPFDVPAGGVLAARYFKSRATGLLLYHRTWRPAGGAAPRAAVYLIHGYGEHSARYEGFAGALTEAGFVVHAMDLMGHGASEGDRAFISSIGDVLADIAQLVADVHPHADPLPRFLFGHSMGGLFAARAAQTLPAGTFAGVVLSAPALAVDPATDTPLNRFLARTLSGIAPRLQVQPLDTRMLCSDPAVVAQYERDPLNYHGAIRVRTGHEVLGAIAAAYAAAPAMTGLPLLVVHSTLDRLCTIDGSRKFVAAAAGLADKTLIEYGAAEGYLHEMLLEPTGAARVGGDIVRWLQSRCDGARAAAEAK